MPVRAKTSTTLGSIEDRKEALVIYMYSVLAWYSHGSCAFADVVAQLPLLVPSLVCGLWYAATTALGLGAIEPRQATSTLIRVGR